MSSQTSAHFASLSLNRIPLDSQHCSKLFLHGDFCLPYEPPLLCTALSVGGTRVLNANLRVRSPSDFSAAGVKWQYRLGSTAETLSASGTLTQAAVVEVLVGRTGNNVQFTYEYIVDRPSTQPPSTQPPSTQPLITTQKPPATQLPPTTISTSTSCPGMLHIRIL